MHHKHQMHVVITAGSLSSGSACISCQGCKLVIDVSLDADGVMMGWSMTRMSLARPWWTGWSVQEDASCLTSPPKAFLPKLSGTHNIGVSLTMRAECQGLLATGPPGLLPSLIIMTQARTQTHPEHLCTAEVQLLLAID